MWFSNHKITLEEKLFCTLKMKISQGKKKFIVQSESKFYNIRVESEIQFGRYKLLGLLNAIFVETIIKNRCSLFSMKAIVAFVHSEGVILYKEALVHHERGMRKLHCKR